MSLIQILLLLFTVHTWASPIARRGTPSFVYPGDVPFTVDTATLAAAVTCPNGNPTQSSPPVLLVHGTGSTGSQTWGEGYVPALLANGYTACYVTLPGRAMGDMQVSSQYVAYAIYLTSYLSGGLQTAIVSHSQGGPVTQWALRFWPSTRKVTRAFIPLSPDFAGIDLLGSPLHNICVGDLCQACLWQQSAGSNYYKYFHADGFSQLVPTTTVWSQFDGVVNPPQQNAQIPGAFSISIQDLCPARPTTHITMTIDAAGFDIALDALNHGGIANLARIKQTAWTTWPCVKVVAAHMSDNVVTDLKALFSDLVDGLILGSPRTTSEPAVMAYAISASGSASNSTKI